MKIDKKQEEKKKAISSSAKPFTQKQNNEFLKGWKGPYITLRSRYANSKRDISIQYMCIYNSECCRYIESACVGSSGASRNLGRNKTKISSFFKCRLDEERRGGRRRRGKGGRHLGAIWNRLCLPFGKEKKRDIVKKKKKKKKQKKRETGGGWVFFLLYRWTFARVSFVFVWFKTELWPTDSRLCLVQHRLKMQVQSFRSPVLQQIRKMQRRT